MFLISQLLNIPIGSVVEATIKEKRIYGFMIELGPGVKCLLHKASLGHDSVSLHIIYILIV